MSRTIRRKSGNRWFATKQDVYVQSGLMYYWEDYIYTYNSITGWDKRPVCWLHWETLQARQEYDQELVSRYTRDRYEGRYSPAIKEYDNYTRRACQRQQLRLIMKGQEHYDNSFEDSKCKGAKWYFD